jgi:hypothetical protein
MKLTRSFLNVILLLGTYSAYADLNAPAVPSFTVIKSVTSSSSDVRGGVVDRLASNTVKSASPSTMAYSASGYAGTNIRLSSIHSYTIVNYTNRPQNYEIEVKLYTADGSYQNRIDTVRVDPQGSAHGSRSVFFYKYFPSNAYGTYTVYASTRISGESSAYTQGSNAVTVYPASK